MKLIIFFAGIVIGVLVSEVIRRVRTGKGYFKLKKIPDEDDMYTINVRWFLTRNLIKRNTFYYRENNISCYGTISTNFYGGKEDG